MMADAALHHQVADTARADVVRGFYDAIASRDAASLQDLMTANFAEDIELVIPGSLPYGGTIAGAGKLARMFTGMLASPTPIGATNVTVAGIVDGGDVVGASIEFDWFYPGTDKSVASGALEVWRFDAGRVVEIRAYYWDTAQLVALAP